MPKSIPQFQQLALAATTVNQDLQQQPTVLKRCFEENEWGYARAASYFLDLKDKIPPTAFVHEGIYLYI
ncbi:nuclear RNA export factor 1-like [Aphis craccivora]|uniref:Nuclear RNA export factor 1-like n=1 Tax=Aphis craccivora TaxID=307492 RepID=A0A6G0ZB66_APHCR|nr:nuclear RNA export factor 1-like [Aphis craccivora]